MALTVTITNNTLAISDTGVAATFNGSELLHPSYIAEVDQLTDGVALTPAPSAEGVVSNYVGNVVNYVVVLRFSDSKHQPLEIRLADVTNQPGWPNTQLGAIQAVTDIAAIMVLTGGGGGGGLTGITGIPGISYAGTPTSVMTVSDAPDAREALGATRNHGQYQAGLVVNGYDILSKDGILYESVVAQFTTTNWGADEVNFVPIGVSPQFAQLRIRSIRTLVNSDSVTIDAADDTIYQSTGSGEYTENVNADAGTQLTFKCDVTATGLLFTPGTGVDGGATLSISAGAYATVQSLGGGNWIQIG